MNSPNRFAQIEALFHAALERPTAERAAFLAQACGADEQLLAEVSALVAAHEQSRNPLDAPVGAVAAQLLVDAPLADASAQSPLSRRRDHPFFWLTLLLGVVLCGYYVFAVVEIYRYGTISPVIGYGFRIESGETVITGVQPDGPAAGMLQIGDRVLDLNGDSRSRWGLGDSVLRSTQGGMPYTLRIARGASEQTVELRVELRPQQYRQLTMVVCLIKPKSKHSSTLRWNANQRSEPPFSLRLAPLIQVCLMRSRLCSMRMSNPSACWISATPNMNSTTPLIRPVICPIRQRRNMSQAPRLIHPATARAKGVLSRARCSPSATELSACWVRVGWARFIKPKT